MPEICPYCHRAIATFKGGKDGLVWVLCPWCPHALIAHWENQTKRGKAILVKYGLYNKDGSKTTAWESAILAVDLTHH